MARTLDLRPDRDEGDAVNWIRQYTADVVDGEFVPSGWKEAVLEWQKATDLEVVELVGCWSEAEHPGTGGQWREVVPGRQPSASALKGKVKLMEMSMDRLFDEEVPALVDGDVAWVDWKHSAVGERLRSKSVDGGSRKENTEVSKLAVLGLVLGVSSPAWAFSQQELEIPTRPAPLAQQQQPLTTLPDSNQVLEISVPQVFRGCWHGDNQRLNQETFAQSIRVCFREHAWSLEVSRPQDTAIQSISDYKAQRTITQMSDKSLAWNTVAVGTESVKWVLGSIVQVDMTHQSSYQCELGTESKSLWCSGTITNYFSYLGRQETRQHVIQMKLEKE